MATDIKNEGFKPQAIKALNVATFYQGTGNVFYKAITHPLAAPFFHDLTARLKGTDFAIYDPDGYLNDFLSIYPDLKTDRVYTHKSELVGQNGMKAIAELDASRTSTLLVLSFEDTKIRNRIDGFFDNVNIETLVGGCIPEDFRNIGSRYLDKTNFVTNFSFFRETDNFSTILTSANYWSDYGAGTVDIWCRLYDENGKVLKDWDTTVKSSESFILDSAELKKRFDLPNFTGQLFLHVKRARGHDVLKYALDTLGKGENKTSLSVTHDANSWPSDYFASLPAPDKGEELIVWVQNSHDLYIDKGVIGFNPMGRDSEVRFINERFAPFETKSIRIDQLFPDVKWPAQFEMIAHKHLARPRYEIKATHGRTRIAHLNVERSDLKLDPKIKDIPVAMGRGFLLPFPLPNKELIQTVLQPNPMSRCVEKLPIRLDIFNPKGDKVASKYLGDIARDADCVISFDDFDYTEGHAELVYDFTNYELADGWLHAMQRYQNRKTKHEAETSFGGHIYNTLMTYKNEPQSYNSPAPGLSTKIFLKMPPQSKDLEVNDLETFCYLIYPTSYLRPHPSKTELFLYSKEGKLLEPKSVSIAPSGSFYLLPKKEFSVEAYERGKGGYIMIRDHTCRIFGYHGLMTADGRFSLDHMFGF